MRVWPPDYPRWHIVWFPPYAPNLNPAELLWSDLKYRRLANFAPDTVEDIQAHVSRESRRLACHSGLLRSFFRDSRRLFASRIGHYFTHRSLTATSVPSVTMVGIDDIQRTGGRQMSLQPMWLAVGMTVFVALFERWALGLPYGKYFIETLETRSLFEFGVRVVAVVAICAAQVLFIWASLVSSYSWRMAYLLAFALATFTEYGYVKATGGVTSAIDFNTALSSTRYWPAMISASVNWWAVIPLAVYGLTLLAIPSRRDGHLRRFLVVVVVTVMLHSAYAATGYLRRDVSTLMSSSSPAPTGMIQAFARSVTMFAWNEIGSALSHGRRQELSYRASRIPSGHIVLVIDESVQADHLSVNGYKRATTPWLEALQKDGSLSNWGVASSVAPESDPSVLLMLTGVHVLPDRERRTLSQPTIFQFAKAMNYRTHLFDGQMNHPRYGLVWDDLRYVDDFKGEKVFGYDSDTDFRIASAVRRILEEAESQFLVVLKRGNHLPYDRNYPPGLGVWINGNGIANYRAPSDVTDSIDSYDSGLRYNLDLFFRGVLREDGTLPRTAMIYTSDHGQTYQDSWSAHAVPLLMFGEARPPMDTGYRASQVNIFATLLDLMGFPEEHRPAAYGRSLLRARTSDRDPRMVLKGDLFGMETFQIRDFDRLPVRPN